MNSLPPETTEWAINKKTHLAALSSMNASGLLSALELDGSDLEELSLEKILENSNFNPEDHLKNLKAVAELIYDHMRYKYSFQEALRTGNYAPLPNELSQINCASQMFVNYCVAAECGLDPEIIELSGFDTLDSSIGASHSIITVDVGDDKRWALDPLFNMLGPVEWGNKRLSVIGVKDRKERKFTFSEAFHYTLDAYLERLTYQRSREGSASMLIEGQLLGYPQINSWKTSRSLPTRAYLTFNPQKMELVTIVGFERNLVQDRGVERRLQVDVNGEVIGEQVTGYFCREIGWAHLAEKYPVISFTVEDIPKLIEGIVPNDVEGHLAFEQRLRGIFSGDIEDPFFEEKVKQSYETTTSDDHYGPAVRAFSIVEALYQQTISQDPKKRNRGLYLTDSARRQELKNQARGNEFYRGILEAEKQLQRQSADFQFAQKHVHLLDPSMREDELVLEYLFADDPISQTRFALGNATRQFYEDLDRVAFVQRVVQPEGTDLAQLEKQAQKMFGDQKEQAILGGYARIFAEFVGYLSMSWDHLQMPQFQESVVRKMVDYKQARLA